jgi:murein DD-endopeptidase MepM/ murein hydrolase activator NlpD
VAGITDAQRYQLARAAGFSQAEAVRATAISIAENGAGDPAVVSASNDLGLWQINSAWWPQFGGKAALSDPLTNARAAHAIFQRQGWSAWATFNKNTYAQFLPRAMTAASSAGTDSAFVFPLPGFQGTIAPHGGVVNGGSDLMAPRGSPIVSMSSGRVTSAGFDSLGGNNVLIHDPSSNLDFYYAHLNESPLVKSGQTVTPGTLLGHVGDTGNAAGGPTHLHIGIGFGIQTGAGAFGGTGKGFDAVGLLRRSLGGSSSDLTGLIRSVGGIQLNPSAQAQTPGQIQITNPIEAVANAIGGGFTQLGTSIHDAIATFVLSLLHVILGIFFLVMILLGLYLLLAN